MHWFYVYAYVLYELYFHYIAGIDVEWPLMKVIITFIFWCDNLWKS